jgi:hypothetical protein
MSVEVCQVVPEMLATTSPVKVPSVKKVIRKL